MKKLLIFFLLPAFLISCSKEKLPNIIGSWEKIATFSSDVNGVFSWTSISSEPYPFSLWLGETGVYKVSFREPMEGGYYHYNPATKDLQFGQTPPNNTKFTVFLLNEDYLVIEKYLNNVLIAKDKYQRQKD